MKKSNALISICAAIAVCLVVFFALIGTSQANALVFSGELLEKRESIQDGSYSYALVMSGDSSGQVSSSLQAMSGNFSTTFEVPGGALQTLRFDFVNKDGNKFSVRYSQTAEFTGFSVETSGQEAGIFYNPGTRTLTSEKNAQGIYTPVESTKKLGLRIDVSTMSVYCSYDGTERLVWNFSQLYNDGRYIGTVLDSFTEYTVSVCFEKVEHGTTGKAYIYDVNGQSFSESKLSDTAGPSVFALADLRPVLGEATLLPAPHAFDIMDGVISVEKVQVSVVSPSGKTDSFQYSENMTYVFSEAGTYSLTYTAKDSAYKKGSYTFDLKPIRVDEVKTEFTYSFTLDTQKLGVGAVVHLPNAVVSNNRSYLNNDLDAQVSVTIDGQNVEVQNMSFKAHKAGNYIVTYSVPYEMGTASESFTVVVEDGLSVLSDVKFNPVYKWNEQISVPNATVKVLGVEYPASKVITYPSGKAYSNSQITLDEEGVYTVTYSVVTGDGSYAFDKTFRVVRTGADSFVDVNGKSDIYEGRVHYYQQASGVMLSMMPGAEVWYTNVIDLNGASRSDFFVTYYIVPSTVGTADFGALRFFLVDIYDENNYVEILCKDSGSVNTGGVGAYTQASSCGQILGNAIESDATLGIRQDNEGGFTTLAGFRGTPFHTHTKDASEGGFSLDYATKKIYPKSSYAFSVVGSHSNIFQITDLDNPNYYSKPWDGFTTGECYLKIVPEQVGSRANVLITSVGGISLAADTAPSVYAPTITLDEYEAKLPDGAVGVPYPIPAYSAISKFYGEVDSVCQVYRQISGKLSQMDITNGAFVPTEAGDYVLKIKAENPDGIATEKTYIFTVQDKAPSLQISIPEKDKVVSGTLGQPIAIAGCTVSGNVGNAEVKLLVTNPEGVTKEMDAIFTPDRSGDWTVNYEVTDYLDRKVTTSYVIKVSGASTPVQTTFPTVPAGFVNGYTYYLPAAYALDYTASETEPPKVVAKIFVTDADGRRELPENGEYVVKVAKHGDAVKVEYVFTGKNGQSKTTTYNSTGLIVSSGKNLDVTKFFATNHITNVSAGKEFIEFAFSSDATASFSRPILVNSLRTVFNVDPAFNNFASIRVTLTDSENANETIHFVISKKTANDTNSSFSLNGGIAKDTRGSFYGNSVDSFVYSYNAVGKSIADASGYSIAVVETTANGDAFTGFSSGKVYISYSFEGVTGASKVNLYNIAGQAFTNATADRTAPSVSIKNSIAGIHKFGSTVVVSDVLATDVLSEIASATVMVTCGDKVILPESSAFETHSIVMSEYGKYFVNYTITDSAGRSYYTEEVLYVRAVEATSVKADKKIPTSVNKGTVLDIPTATVSGGTGETAYCVLVLSPDGRMYRWNKTKLTLDQAGEWMIRYFAYDSYYNCSYADYVINVK